MQKKKTFDCVEMKNRIQAERLAEYEARKGEFATYVDFINARVEGSAAGGNRLSESGRRAKERRRLKFPQRR